MKIINQEVVVQ